MAIGTTAAITMAAIGGGVAAYSAREQSKAIKSAAQTQADVARESTDVARGEFGEALALQKELAQPKLEFEREQLDLYREIFGPGIRDLAPRIEEQLDQPLSLPQEVWDEIYRKGEERIAGQFDPLMERTTQRLAGGGPGKLRGGVAQSLFVDIEKEKIRSIEDFAIDQSIAEWQEKKAAKQQSLSNVFSYLQGTPSVGQPQVPFTTPPAPYVPPAQPTVSSGVGEGFETAFRLAGLFSSPKEAATHKPMAPLPAVVTQWA